MTERKDVAAAGKTLAETTVEVVPVRRWELHIVHQTHLDIGYTHTQEDVLKLQVEWLRRAMQCIEKSKDYPEAAQFKWHPEGMWAVDEFMRTATEEEKRQFVEVCRRGQIHLDVLYAQAMTGMYTEEELMELMGAAKLFEKQYGVPVTSAMQSDVPGYTWGLASALAHCGVPYMSLGPNGGHRVGHTFHWGDRPFWWMSPDGKHKVLFWMCGGGYYGLRDAREDAIFAALRRAGDGAEWVDAAKAEGLNSYLYIIGRDANQGRARVAGPARVIVEDAAVRSDQDCAGGRHRGLADVDRADAVLVVVDHEQPLGDELQGGPGSRPKAGG